MRLLPLLCIIIIALLPVEGFSASQSIWGSTDRGPVVGTYRIPVDTGASSTPGYITPAEMVTYMAGQTVLTLTTTGTSGAASYSGGTLNIPQYTNSTFQAAMAAISQLNSGGL